MLLPEKFVQIYYYNLRNSTDQMIYKQIDCLRHKTGLDGYALEVRHGLGQQIDLEIERESSETNLFRPVFFGSYLKRNGEWEFSGRFGYEKHARIIFLVSYIFLAGLLALCLVIPELRIIAAGVCCVMGLLIALQLIAHVTSTNDRNEILEIVENSIFDIKIWHHPI